MKVENLLIILVSILVILLVLSVTLLGAASLDIHLHDTYYVINISHVVGFCLIITLIDFLLYRLIGYKPGRWNNWISLLQFFFLVLFFLCMSYLFVKQQESWYFQSSLLIWATLSLLLSKILLAVYFFLPKEGIK
jgi:heme/copper-type cytochrome/quinol oxidase subunit 1